MRESVAHVSEDFTKRVAAEVRADAARQELTQDQLAAKAGMSKATLSRRYAGEYPWNIDELFAVARVLGVPVSRWILAAEAANPWATAQALAAVSPPSDAAEAIPT